MSESVYWQLVNDLVSTGHDRGQPKSDIREEIVERVQAAFAAGEPWAMETLQRWELTGADDDYTRVYKDMNAVTYIRRDGRRVRKTAGYSRPVRSPESGEIIGQQMQAWWGMSRPELAELYRDIELQRERLGDVVAIVAELMAAMDRHPECATARDAWEADGRSVSEINLGEATA